MKQQKVVLKVEIYDDKIKQKAMKAVSGLSGVESVSVEMKDKKFTLTGDIDPVHVVAKLRKFCRTEIVSVGPAKEEKKEEPKKVDQKKPDDKKDSKKENAIAPPQFYETYGYYYHINPPLYNHYYCTPRCVEVEENPNGCVII